MEGRPYFVAGSDLAEDDTECLTQAFLTFAGINNASGCGMTDKPDSSFVVVRFNELTYQPGAVVAVIKGIKVAQRTLADFDWSLSEEQRRAGWRYFLEKTDLRPGMDAERATALRQVRFDLQEA